MAERKGVAFTSLIALLLAGGIVIGGAAALSQINNILELLISHLYYLILAGVIFTLGGYFIMQSRKDKIGKDQMYGPVIILVALAIIGSATGVALGEITESYTATVEVTVSQDALGMNQPKLQSVSVNKVERKSPGIFGNLDRQACIVMCDRWKVTVQVYCDNERIATQDVTGKGQKTVSTEFPQLPEGQCRVEATPGDGMQGSTLTTYFSVGDDR